MKQKALSSIGLLLCVLMVFLSFPLSTYATNGNSAPDIWDGSISTSFTRGDNGEYLITSGADLALFRKKLDSNEPFNDCYFILTNDIYLNDVSNWQEWSFDSSPNNVFQSNNKGFSGTFNGNNHTIYGLYSVSGSLFGAIGHLDKILNLKISSSYFYGNSPFVNTVTDGTISNCSFDGKVESTGSCVSGIASRANYCSHIENCVNIGSIYGYEEVGGIVGECDQSKILTCLNVGEINGNAKTGGIAGRIYGGDYQSLIQNSINYGTVNGTDGVGGIAGSGSSSRNEANIESCVNYGKVNGSDNVGGIVGIMSINSSLWKGSGIKKSANHGKICGEQSVGGIIGNISGRDGLGIQNCYNDETIEGNDYVGGIVGNTDNYSRYYYRGINLCFNICETKSVANHGGIAGANNEDISCYNCYYLDSESGNVIFGSPLSINQFSQKSSFQGFDFENTWEMNTDKGYPELRLTDMPSYNPPIDTLSDVDLYIIEQVKKYTSEGFSENSTYNYIMNSQASEEVKMKVLNEYFVNNGFTDAKEGIDYLRDTSTYRDDYRFLTTNEIFCANNFYDWLYSDKGFWARASLYTDGLIFNSEFTAYLDPTTYIEDDYPGVKKNKKFLKDFLEQDSKELVFLKESKEVGSFLEMMIKQNGIEYTNAVKELKQKVESAKTLTERENYQNQLAAIISEKVQSVNSNKLYFNGKKFTEALGTAVDTIEFVNATTSDIIQIINLDNEITKYEYYRDFLSEIANSSYISDDMRMAASSLLDEIKDGYYNRIVSILDSTLEYVDGMMSADKSKWEYFFGDNGAVFGDALTTIKLATFIDNIIVDTGDFVNKVSYTLGYAELSKLFSTKLKQDKTNFISSQTKKNAWQFFSDYSMLWSLRYKGEEQYLKMSKLKMFVFGEVKTSDYPMKNEIVTDNLNLLNQKKFEFAANYTIPEGVMYSSKAVINCPVDVYVYNQSGELIAELKDGVESDVTNEYGRFAVMKQSYSGEYAKVVALNNPDDVVIKSVAHSQGLVDYSFASVNNGEVKTYSISNISVDSGAIISTSKNTQTYAIDYDGDGNNETEGQLLEGNSEYVAVSAINSDVSEVSLTTGQQQLLNISIAPNNATNQMVDWFTDKEDVVSIKNGVVNALKPGNATVYAKAIDSEDAMLPFIINVVPKATVTGHSISLNGDIGINYFVDVPAEEVNNGKVNVDFSWMVDNEEKTYTVTLSSEDKTEYGYKASCPVAVAEMTYDVTAVVTIDGVAQSIPDSYSAQKYANVILNNENNFREKYIAAENGQGRNGEQRYNDLVTLVQTMLDYGTKAQIVFDRDKEHPANEGTDYFNDETYPVTSNMITVTEENMDMDLSAYGLRYKGSTVVYLSETSIRHYYYVDNWDSFNNIKNSVTFDGAAVTYTEKDDAIYFEKKGVSASNLDTPYTLTIKDKSCKLSVNDYIRHCLESTKVSDNTKALVKATYRYNVAANAFFEV